MKDNFVLNFMISLLVCMVGVSAAPTEGSISKADIGALAYISDYAGRDVIIVKDRVGTHQIYQCANENEMILTPGISPKREVISFVIENGENHRAVHRLKVKKGAQGAWLASDSIIIHARNAAWPTYAHTNILFLSMMDPREPQLALSTDIYSISGDQYLCLSNNSGLDKHLWPLLSPDEQQLHFRKIATAMPGGDGNPIVSSVIFDLELNTREVHLVGQRVYVEQWTANNLLLVSQRLTDEAGTRVYALYDPDTRESTEVYRNSSYQAQLAPDANYLATLRLEPAGGSNFDIFITDLYRQTELNLTNTPNQSESLIGWLE